MAAGLFVRAGAEDGAVVLRDVEIDRPRAERGGEFDHGFVKLGRFPMVIFGDDAVGFGVFAERVKQRVRHVGLEADDFGHVHGLEEVHHVLPAVHAAPADFAFGGEAFTGVFGDLTGFAEGLGDEFGDALGIGVPGFDAGGAVDADDAVGAHAEIAEFFGDADGFADVVDPVGARRGVTAGGGIEPHGGDDGTDDEALGLDLGGEGFDTVLGDIDIGVRIVEEEIDAIEFHAADIGFRGEIEHGVEADERLGPGGAFADETGPGCVMEFREVIGGHFLEGS